MGLEASLAFVLNQNGPFGALASPVHSQGAESVLAAAGRWFARDRDVNSKSGTETPLHPNHCSLGFIQPGSNAKKASALQTRSGLQVLAVVVGVCTVADTVTHLCCPQRKNQSQCPAAYPLHTCWGVLVYLLETCRGHSFLSTMEVFAGKA